MTRVGSIAGFEIDVILSEEHSFESDVTENPVEEGGVISDHVRARPGVVNLEGIVSNTPHGDLKGRRSTDTLPVEDFRAYMDQLRAEAELITVITSARTYKQVVLQNWSEREDAKSGDACRFRASFKEIRIVTTDREVVQVALPRAKRKVNLGNKAAVPPPAVAPPSPQTDKNASALHRWKSGEGFLQGLDSLNPF